MYGSRRNQFQANTGGAREVATRSLLRPSKGEDAHRVSYAELFFDLVFVFAVTQVSHLL
ncbi:MAG: low temperature requirement protein A, partial [Microbacteriaceae bacterium]|nr:low temperature requirement protein A [Microbacteriaceae bacterium]